MFPAWHIALTALVTAAITVGGMAVLPPRTLGYSRFAVGDLIGVGIAAGLGVLLWRLGANIPTVNDDPIPGVSPADVLSAPLAFVGAEIYVRLHMVSTSGQSERLTVAPAVAAVVALIVNIVTI